MKRSLLALLVMVFSLPIQAQMAITSESFDRVRMSEVNDVSQLAVRNSYEVVSISVDALIRDQMADVSVTQVLHNPGNRSLEVEIFFPLPHKGIV